MKKCASTTVRRAAIASLSCWFLLFGAPVSYLCGASLTIARAVHVSWPSGTNVAYQVQTSSNLNSNWTSIGGLVEGNGGQVGEFFMATNSQGFFRVQETTASGMEWLEGDWRGLISQAIPGVITNTFVAQFSISNSNRVFTSTSSSEGGGTCTANLSLISYSDTQAYFQQRIQSGACIDASLILCKIDQTNIGCVFFLPGQSSFIVGSAGGTLSKQ